MSSKCPLKVFSVYSNNYLKSDAGMSVKPNAIRACGVNWLHYSEYNLCSSMWLLLLKSHKLYSFYPSLLLMRSISIFFYRPGESQACSSRAFQSAYERAGTYGLATLTGEAAAVSGSVGEELKEEHFLCRRSSRCR